MAEIEAKEKATQVNKDMKVKLAQLRDISEMYNSANLELSQTLSDLTDYLATPSTPSVDKSGGDGGF